MKIKTITAIKPVHALLRITYSTNRMYLVFNRNFEHLILTLSEIRVVISAPRIPQSRFSEAKFTGLEF